MCLPGFYAKRRVAVDVSREWCEQAAQSEAGDCTTGQPPQTSARRDPVADARERAVRDILAMSFWSEYMQDDVVYTSQIRDYLQELERLR